MKIFSILIACFSRLSACVAECLLSFLSVAFSQGPSPSLLLRDSVVKAARADGGAGSWEPRLVSTCRERS